MCRTLFLHLLAALVLAVAGCSTSAPTQAPLVAPHDVGGRQIRIAVGNTYPPFSFIDEDTGEPAGWDYDVCRAICGVIDCVPVFVEAERFGLLEAVASGEYDMMADGLIITPEREGIVDFSIPYMVVRQVLVVRIDETRIVDKASLVASEAVVGAQVGTVNEHIAVGLLGEDRVRRFDTSRLSIQVLVAGDVDAVVMGGREARTFVAEYADTIRIVEEPLVGEDRLGFAFPPGSDLIQPVNYALRVLEEDGTLDQLLEKWCGQ